MGHQLHCSVCENILESKESWNKHLLEESHQQLARKECSNRWWVDEHLRQCCLALFSSVPLSPQLCEEIISEFSKKVNVYVTDFVWWNGRPKVALLQFESKNIAKQIWKGHGDTSVGSFGPRVQLRKAWVYLQLESKIFAFRREELVGVPDVDVIPELENVSVHAKIPERVDVPIPAVTEGSPLPSALPDTSAASISKVPTVDRLTTDYKWIKNVMTYPTESFHKLNRFIGSLKKLSKTENYQTGFVRNHYLGIRSSNLPEMVHVFIYSPGKNRSGCIHSKDLIKEMISRLENQWCLPDFRKDARFGTVLKSRSCPTLLNILTLGAFYKEFQVCRLILYLCRLDSRLRGVLTLVEFWAKYHDLKVANNIKGRSWKCQDPLGLHLLVVVYLMNQKLLPSVQRLQPPKMRKMIDSCRFLDDGVFKDSWRQTNYCPAEWSPTWINSVVQLTRDCFQFFSEKLASGRWILSCYDGVVLNYDEVQKGRDWPMISFKERIYLAHPFNRMHKCAFDMTIWETRMCPVMGGTAKQLSEYLAGEESQDLRLADALAGNRDYHRTVQGWLDNCELKNCTLSPLT